MAEGVLQPRVAISQECTGAMTIRAKIIALVLGIGVMVPVLLGTTNISLSLKITVFAAAFALPAFVAAWVAPRGGWKWGLLLVTPFLALMLLSLAFAGYLEVFIQRDLPLVSAAAGGAIGGAFLGARCSPRASVRGY